MSEHGWRFFLDFLDAEEGDWVVVHGGASAVFRTSSLGSAAALARAIANAVGDDAPQLLMTLSALSVTVRLTRGMFRLEEEHVALAQRISALAREHSAHADRAAVQEVQVAIAARPADSDVGFWRAALGYDALAEDNAIDPIGHSSTVWMQELDEARPLRHAMHVDVSLGREFVSERLAAAIDAGGRIVLSEAPASWVLADPAGNRVCLAAWPDGAEPVSDSSDGGEQR